MNEKPLPLGPFEVFIIAFSIFIFVTIALGFICCFIRIKPNQNPRNKNSSNRRNDDDCAATDYEMGACHLGGDHCGGDAGGDCDDGGCDDGGD